MTFKQRLPYFAGGLIIGIIIVNFIWKKKGTEFNYGPNSRVLKNLSTKERMYSKNALKIIENSKIDTASVSQILKNGNVDLGNKIKLDSCFYQYTIQGKKELKNVTLTIVNCESTAIVEDITIK